MKVKSENNPDVLQFLQGGKSFQVSPTEIIRLEARSNYTCVYFNEHRPVLMAKVLRIYEEKLRPFGFIRTHRSHLVNPQYVQNVNSNGVISMSDTSHVGISRRRKQQVQTQISLIQ